MKGKIIISSFNHLSVMRMKVLCPDIKCGLLTESWLIEPGHYVKKCGVECYHPIFCSLDKETVAEVKSQGIEINTWTVNEEEHIRDMIRLGVDSVIGNFPDRITKVRDEGDI